MPSFMTINKVDGSGNILKHDVYHTEQGAKDRIVELKALGLSDAFYVPYRGDAAYVKVDAVEKSITYDGVQHEFDIVTDQWKNKMSTSDGIISRSTEDIYDAMGVDAQANVSGYTRDKIAAKKELRSQKPTKP